MKYIFIVQGEGREQFMQAIALERMLEDAGHEVVEVLAGVNARRKVPEWFSGNVSAPVSEFTSVSLIFPRLNGTIQSPEVLKKIYYRTITRLKNYPGIRRIRRHIRASGADVAVNFNELLAGLTYKWLRIRVPMVWIGTDWKNFASRIGAIGAVKRLVVSPAPGPEDRRHRVRAVPPILRPEILTLRNEDGTPGPKIERGDYVLAYMPGHDFADEILRLHKESPQTRMHVFWDRWSAGETHAYDDTLTFHLFDLELFTAYMAGCGAFLDTGRSEPLWEAMYLGKPILSCDFSRFPATDSGEGSPSDPPGGLIPPDFNPDVKFITWVRAAEKILLTELTTGLRRRKKRSSRRP